MKEHNRQRLERFKGSSKRIGSRVKSVSAEAAQTLVSTVKMRSSELAGAVSFPFLSQDQILEWTEKISSGTTSVYDKAMDSSFIASGIGGPNHRMFDGGHDLGGAWERARGALSDDSRLQEVAGYASGIWKDLTTEQGLPFLTWSKDTYDSSATWIAEHIPGATRSWFYDLNSFDVAEVASSGLGVAASLFFLSKSDQEKLSELLGAMGITAIIAANPLLGLSAILVAAYSYFVKKHKIEGKRLVRGLGLAGVSAAIFAVFGLPLLIELGLVLVLNKLIREHILDRPELLKLISRRLKEMLQPENVKQELALAKIKIARVVDQAKTTIHPIERI